MIIAQVAVMAMYPVVKPMSKSFTNVGQATPPVGVKGIDSESEVYASGLGYHNGTVTVWDYDSGEDLSKDASNIYIELRIPREYLSLPTTGTISVGCSYGWYETEKVSINL